MDAGRPTPARSLIFSLVETRFHAIVEFGRVSQRSEAMRRTVLLLFALSLATLAWAPVAFAEKRVALVIGNGAYANATPLPNPRNDAEDVAAALKREGFETIVGFDLDQAKMQETAHHLRPRCAR